MNRATSVICALIIVIITTKVTVWCMYLPDRQLESEASPDRTWPTFVKEVEKDLCSDSYLDDHGRQMAHDKCEAILEYYDSVSATKRIRCPVAEGAQCYARWGLCGLWRWQSRCTFVCSSSSGGKRRRVSAVSLSTVPTRRRRRYKGGPPLTLPEGDQSATRPPSPVPPRTRPSPASPRRASSRWGNPGSP
ncbi:unnamed protein product [Bemisia tabaci]|uniref:Uncharacterized protein n=1 Tax=Bemisia tabaci TaxID=7038 RepID=A0A9P0AFS0_BEMTA|nr:unnamed protein product [Bemisia tabaci]